MVEFLTMLLQGNWLRDYSQVFRHVFHAVDHLSDLFSDCAGNGHSRIEQTISGYNRHDHLHPGIHGICLSNLLRKKPS